MSGSAVEVIDSGKSRGMRSIEQTTAYGYSTKDAQLAMSECRDDSDAALSMLYARLTGKPFQVHSRTFVIHVTPLETSRTHLVLRLN